MNDGTLFRPDQRLSGGSRKPSRGGGGGNNDDDEIQVTLKDRLLEATRSAKRRKVLTVVMLLLGLAITAIAAILAPRSYESEAEILVARTQAIQGGAAFAPTGDENKQQAKEFEAQIMSRDNIVAIVKATELVERWDAMRQPHRKMLDRLGNIFGTPPLTDEQKFNALVLTIEAKMKVFVDATTVRINMEWSEPESARDIVQAAVKNFQDSRYGVEVGVIPERVKILEANVARAKGDVEKAFLELQARQAPVRGPTEKKTIYITRPGQAPQPVSPQNSAAATKLADVDQQIAGLEQQKQARLQELNQKLGEMQQTYAAGHPDVIALKATIAATQQDSPQLSALKQQDKALRAELSAQPAPGTDNPTPAPERQKVTIDVPTNPDPANNTPKSVADVQAQFETAQRKYEGLLIQLETERVQQQTAEAAFKHRYSVTHPAEAPAKPKRPVGAIAALVGILATILLALIVATLADRFSGIFFEPRDVRDRLGLPVFATMKW